MSDDELTLLCTPLRLSRLAPPLPGAQVRWCVQCGSEIYVSASALRQVDSGRVKPSCMDHDLPPDAVVVGPSTSQRAELRRQGMTDREIGEMNARMTAWAATRTRRS